MGVEGWGAMASGGARGREGVKEGGKYGRGGG